MEKKTKQYKVGDRFVATIKDVRAVRGHEEIAEYFRLRRKGLRSAYAHVA